MGTQPALARVGVQRVNGLTIIDTDIARNEIVCALHYE